MMNVKSLILARGGSKGIPKKNIVLLKGKPLIWYSIRAAQESSSSEVWVSSNDSEILKLAEEYGAKPIRRPDSIAQDYSKSEESLLHFAENVEFDVLVFIQPTSPMILPSDIDEALSLLPEFDSVFSAYREHWIPRWTLDGVPFNWETSLRPMRQDMPELWVENGAFYVTKKSSLLESGLRYSGKIGVLEMPVRRSFQVDNYHDLEIVEKLIDSPCNLV